MMGSPTFLPHEIKVRIYEYYFRDSKVCDIHDDQVAIVDDEWMRIAAVTRFRRATICVDMDKKPEVLVGVLDPSLTRRVNIYIVNGGGDSNNSRTVQDVLSTIADVPLPLVTYLGLDVKNTAMDVDAVTRQLARSFPILRELELRLQGTPCDVREVLRTVGESLESVTDLKVQVSDDPDTGASERDIGSRGLGLVGVNPRKFTRLLLDQNSLTGDELMQVLDSQRELADLRLGSVSYAQTLMRLEGRVYHQLTRLALGRLKLEGSAHRQWGLNAVVFPNLRSLIIADFCVSNGDIGSAVGTFEQLFAQPWASLVEVSVPLLTDNIISKIVEACSHSLEALRFRIGGPERANRSETFQLIIRDKLLLTSAGFATLVTKLPKLAMLELLNESGGLQAVTHLDGTIVRPPRARRALRWECRFLCVLRIARTFLTPTSFWDIVDQLPQLCCVDTGIKAEPEWLFENDGGKTSIEAITKSRSDRHQNLRYIKLSVKSPTIPYELWAQMATLLPQLTTLTFVSGMYLRARYKSICYQLSYEFPSIHFRAETKSCLPI